MLHNFQAVANGKYAWVCLDNHTVYTSIQASQIIDLSTCQVTFGVRPCAYAHFIWCISIILGCIQSHTKFCQCPIQPNCDVCRQTCIGLVISSTASQCTWEGLLIFTLMKIVRFGYAKSQFWFYVFKILNKYQFQCWSKQSLEHFVSDLQCIWGSFPVQPWPMYLCLFWHYRRLCHVLRLKKLVDG